MNPKLLDYFLASFFMIFITFCLMWPVTLKNVFDSSLIGVALIFINLFLLRLIFFFIKKHFKISDSMQLIDLFKFKTFSIFYDFTVKPLEIYSNKYFIEGHNGEDYYTINKSGRVKISFSKDLICFKSYDIDLKMKVVSSKFEYNSRYLASNKYFTDEGITVYFDPFYEIVFLDKDEKRHVFKKLSR